MNILNRKLDKQCKKFFTFHCCFKIKCYGGNKGTYIILLTIKTFLKEQNKH